MNSRYTHLDDGMDKWQVLFIVNCRQPIASNYAIKFLVRLRLNFRVGGNKRREPLHDRCSLELGHQYKSKISNTTQETYRFDAADHESGAQNCHVEMI